MSHSDTELRGVDKTFEEIFSENPEFSFAAITNMDGRMLYSYGKEPPGALVHCDRHRILQVRASNFQDLAEFLSFLEQRPVQFV